MHSNLPLLQLHQPRIEKLEILNRNLLRRPRNLGRLIRLPRRPHPQILEIIVDRVIRLALALREREDVEVELFALLKVGSGRQYEYVL